MQKIVINLTAIVVAAVILAVIVVVVVCKPCKYDKKVAISFMVSGCFGLRRCE